MAINKAYLGGHFNFTQAKVWIPPILRHEMRRDLFWVSSKDPDTGDTVLTEQKLGKFMSCENIPLNTYWKRFEEMSEGVLILTSPRIKTSFENNPAGKAGATSHGPKFVLGDNWSETFRESSMHLGLSAAHTPHLTAWAYNHFGQQGNLPHMRAYYKVPNISEMTKLLTTIGIHYKALNRVFVPLLFIHEDNPSCILCNVYYPARVCHYTQIPASVTELNDRLNNVCDIVHWRQATNPDFINESFKQISQGFSLEPAYLYNFDSKGKMRSQYIYLAHDQSTGQIWVFTNKKRDKRNSTDMMDFGIEVQRVFLKEGTAAAMRFLFNEYAEMSFNTNDVNTWNKNGVRFNIVSTF